MVGTEKVNSDEEDDTGAVGTKLNGTAEEDAAGADEAEETDARAMFGNAAGADPAEAAALAGWAAEEPVHRKTTKQTKRKTHVVHLITS